MAQPKIKGTGHGIPRTVFGSDTADHYEIYVDSDGHLHIDIETTALPTGAATEAKQDTMITALQLIDDLRNALGSVNTDDLQVDVKTSPLPTDAAKETKQDTMITALQFIDDLRNALGSVNTDDLQVDVKTSPLPTDAATATNQATMITALQLIDDLRNALGSVNTDDLQVDVKTYPGSNVLGNFSFGYNDRYAERVSQSITSTGYQSLSLSAVPAGEIWVVTFASRWHSTGAVSNAFVGARIGAENYWGAAVADEAVNVPTVCNASMVLKEGDYVYTLFNVVTQPTVNDLCAIGYKMKIA